MDVERWMTHSELELFEYMWRLFVGGLSSSLLELMLRLLETIDYLGEERFPRHCTLVAQTCMR